MSLPSWGAWIEMVFRLRPYFAKYRSLPSWGAWIEISTPWTALVTGQRRSPHGERGLKLPDPLDRHQRTASLPSQGVWIEITATATWPSARRFGHPNRLATKAGHPEISRECLRLCLLENLCVCVLGQHIKGQLQVYYLRRYSIFRPLAFFTVVSANYFPVYNSHLL